MSQLDQDIAQIPSEEDRFFESMTLDENHLLEARLKSHLPYEIGCNLYIYGKNYGVLERFDVLVLTGDESGRPPFIRFRTENDTLELDLSEWNHAQTY